MGKTAISMAMGKYRMIKVLFLFLFSVSVMACSNKPCREVNMDGVPENIQATSEAKNILVYKYDGTKQCGEGQEITLDAMSRQLRDVKIVSMSKKHDGMMRIQVCGAPTGHANVYEISEKDLVKAKSYGFLPWKF
jgi:hypothetical protein